MVVRSRCGGGFAEVDDRGGLERTLRIYGYFLVHIFIDIHLNSRSVAEADHCSRSRSRQFHGSITGTELSPASAPQVHQANALSHSQHPSSPDLFRFGVRQQPLQL